MSRHPFHAHPGVRTGEALSRAERAADAMKRMLATWTALVLVLAVIVFWLATGVFGFDPSPWFKLNLTLSCFAALQCFVLLIANRRGEQIAAELAMHDHEILTELRRHVGCMHTSPQTGACTCGASLSPSTEPGR